VQIDPIYTQRRKTMATDTDSWFPLFEFQDWFYQSFLLLPTTEETGALPGTAVTAKKMGKG
jgi:hypothetical protein